MLRHQRLWEDNECKGSCIYAVSHLLKVPPEIDPSDTKGFFETGFYLSDTKGFYLSDTKE